MSDELTNARNLESLRKEAKRWLKALRNNVAEAQTRLARVLSNIPGNPTLRDVQHALALEYGFTGWVAMKGAIAGRPATEPDRERIVNWFLENACPDHHIRGSTAHMRASGTAMRLLARYPEIASYDLSTQIVCGDVTAVQQVLDSRPQVVHQRKVEPTERRAGVGGNGDWLSDFGPKGWEPLLYLCFTRLPLEASTRNALAIARMLLEKGANPNVYFMAGDSHYTPLTGATGEGEEDRPGHARRDELVQLLLEYGAEPFDVQVFYNIHFHADPLWYLKLIYAQCEKTGRMSEWKDPEWRMIDMGGYGYGTRYLMKVAIDHDDMELAEWCLTHGASPNAPVTPTTKKPEPKQVSLYEQALRNGSPRIAELLARYGAREENITVTGIEAFVAACSIGDVSAAQRMASEHPEYLLRPEPLFIAAKRNRADIVKMLLDLGMSPDIASAENERALHMAAYQNAVPVAALLIERGAEIDPVESSWSNTPLGAAVHGQHREMIALLSRSSRDIRELTHVGAVDRVREILAEKPERARVQWDGHTPLMWLPGDSESRAIELATMLIAKGADATVRNSDGHTAADRAQRLGMFTLVAILRAAEHPADRPNMER